MALTATKKSRKAYVVDPLVVADNPAQYEPDECAKEWLSDIAAAETIADIKTVFGAAYKAGRSKQEKDAFKAAYDARTSESVSYTHLLGKARSRPVCRNVCTKVHSPYISAALKPCQALREFTLLAPGGLRRRKGGFFAPKI